MAALNNAAPVGVVGLGLLGGAVSRRLLAAGYAVCGFDIDAAKAQAIAGLRAVPLAEIAACERVLVAVFTAKQAHEVIAQLGRKEKSQLLICSVTCEPQTSVELAQAAHALGWRYLEAPLSGTSAQVAAGDGVALLAGAPEDMAAAADLFAVICARSYRVGAVGDAGKAKLAVNLILGLNRLALAEGLVFAQRMGLDGAAFLEIARGSASYSQVMDTKGAKMLHRDFSPEGRTEQTLKDVGMMLAEAKRLGQPLPSLEAHRDALQACVAQGEGALDSSVVVEHIRRLGSKDKP